MLLSGWWVCILHSKHMRVDWMSSCLANSHQLNVDEGAPLMGHSCWCLTRSAWLQRIIIRANVSCELTWIGWKCRKWMCCLLRCSGQIYGIIPGFELFQFCKTWVLLIISVLLNPFRRRKILFLLHSFICVQPNGQNKTTKRRKGSWVEGGGHQHAPSIFTHGGDSWGGWNTLVEVYIGLLLLH